MPAIFLLLIVLLLVVVGLVRWMGNRRGEEGRVHDHPIDRDSTF